MSGLFYMYNPTVRLRQGMVMMDESDASEAKYRDKEASAGL
jgi:hypothetical protein